MVTLVVAALLGGLLGVVTGMPIGVVNVAIVDAASRGRLRFAIGIGIGGAIADAIHAAIAFVGVGQLVTSRPELVRILAIAAACMIAGYVAVAWRRRDRPIPTVDGRSRGIATGLVMTLPNPGALTAWVAVAAALWPTAPLDVALALAAGVGAGSAVWFVVLARWIASIRADHPARAMLPKVALVTLVVVAALGIARAW